ncbi:hypothetical protein ACP4OV_003744 [Aristida adscensionis]
MEGAEPEAKLGGDVHGHKRPDPEKTVGEAFDGGDAIAKRQREGDDDHTMAMDEDAEEEKVYTAADAFEIHRKEWVDFYGRGDASAFYNSTELVPMLYTDGPVLPMHLEPTDTMEVFFIKVTHISSSLQWPLEVYGDVAVRDSADHKRIYLFRRNRDNCQTLISPQDSLLELTGPSRAIIVLDAPIFEIDLKVKAKESSSSSQDDMLLCLDYFGYNPRSYWGETSYAITEVVSGQNCAMEFRFAHLKRSLEATITARIVSGPRKLTARLTAHTTSIGGEIIGGEEVVLLDSGGREVAVAGEEGTELVLRRRVVVVEERGELVLVIKAAQLDGGGGGGDESSSCSGTSDVIEKHRRLSPRHALRSITYAVIGPTKLEIMVAWSLL